MVNLLFNSKITFFHCSSFEYVKICTWPIMNQLLYHEMIDVTTASQRELALCNKPCPQY